jgi:hypothetical protein
MVNFMFCVFYHYKDFDKAGNCYTILPNENPDFLNNIPDLGPNEDIAAPKINQTERNLI